MLYVLQPRLGCVTLLAGGLVSSGCVVKEEAANAVVAVNAVPRGADDGPAKLPGSGPRSKTGAINFVSERVLGPAKSAGG